MRRRARIAVTDERAAATRRLINHGRADCSSPVIKLAARHRLPAVYPYPINVTGGGLISYGPDLVDQRRRAAGYASSTVRGRRTAAKHRPNTNW